MRPFVAAVLLLLLLAACTGGQTAPGSSTTVAGPDTTTPAPATTTTEAAAAATTSPHATTTVFDPDRPHWTYGALGDGHTYGAPDRCGDCVAYPTLVTEAIAADRSIPVLLLDGSQPGPLNAGDLLDQIRGDDWGQGAGSVRTDRSPRQLIAESDIITIAVGSDDLPWYQDSDPCLLVYDLGCIDRIVEPLAGDIDAILGEVDAIRGGRPTVVMVSTLWNDVIKGADYTAWMYDRRVTAQADSGVRRILDVVNDEICRIAGEHGAVCLDMYDLFNGRHGTEPLGAGYLDEPYRTLNQQGHDDIAAAMMTHGFAPLAPPSG